MRSTQSTADISPGRTGSTTRSRGRRTSSLWSEACQHAQAPAEQPESISTPWLTSIRRIRVISRRCTPGHAANFLRNRRTAGAPRRSEPVPCRLPCMLSWINGRSALSVRLQASPSLTARLLRLPESVRRDAYGVGAVRYPFGRDYGLPAHALLTIPAVSGATRTVQLGSLHEPLRRRTDRGS